MGSLSNKSLEGTGGKVRADGVIEHRGGYIDDPVVIEMLDLGPDGLKIEGRKPGTKHVVDGALARHYVDVLGVAAYASESPKAGGETRTPAPGNPQDRAIKGTGKTGPRRPPGS